MKNWKRCVGGALLVLGLAILPQCSFGNNAGAPAEMRGIVLEGAAKQDYIKEQMDAIFATLENEEDKPFAAPTGWTYEKINIGDVPVERLAPPQPKSQRVFLQLHGGGYMGGLTNLYRAFAVCQAEYTDAAEVYCVDYRLAPAHVYPAALEDAVTVYRGLLARGVDPANIILFGDSAGGNLAVELAIHLRDEGIPQPAVLILASPWADFEDKEGTSRTWNFEKDKTLGKGTPLGAVVHLRPPYAGSLPLDDPRLSPIHADLSALPPMLIQTGGFELFLTEDELLAEKATADGTPVTFTVYPEMPHVFALVLPELAESIASLEEMRDFVNHHMQP